MNLDDLRWFDLGLSGGSRRDFLRCGASALALIALGATPARGNERRPRFRDDPFTCGIASGDPGSDGVVLWTRLAPETLRIPETAATGIPVRWEVAEDETFRTVVRRGEVLALDALDHTVHAEVEGLAPDRVYHYRFIAGDAMSAAGRTRTTQAAGAASERLRLAVASCQEFERGYYTAYRHMAEEDLDLVVHLGDYIYEKTWGDNLIRPHEGGETFTLEDYRRRYAQYRSDAHLQAAHAAFPWVIVWDDHEVDNNYAGQVPEDSQHPDAFLLRRAAAYQAFYEFMPLRRSAVPRGPAMPLYRRFTFGNLATMFALDTRQYRDDQACGDGNKPSCAAQRDPRRTLLGDEQERWLLEGLRGSGARWNVLAQQVMMASLMQRTAEGDTLYSMDKWDGYPAARRRILEAFASERVRNPIVLTGDIHSSWVADLKVDFENPRSPVVGTEFVGTSITSGGDGQEVYAGFGRTREWNPHIHFYNGRRGYVRVDLAPERAAASFRAVPWVTQPGAPLETRAVYVVEADRPGAQRAE